MPLYGLLCVHPCLGALLAGHRHHRCGRTSYGSRRGAHHHGTARAGEHAPDPDGLLRPDGARVTVEDLLTRPGMLLLFRSSDDVDDLRRTLGDLGTVVRIRNNPAGAAEHDVVDPDNVLGRAYGWAADGHGMALIRPGGYLGLVADSTDAAILRTCLADTRRLRQPTSV